MLFTRDDAFIHLPDAQAREEVRAVEREFWAAAKHADGSALDQDELTRALIEGGVTESQALRWSRAIVWEEEVDGIELRTPELCAHCGSALRADSACGVCGQPRGSVPERDADGGRAARLVRQLVAAGQIELVAAHSEAAVVGVTAAVFDAHDAKGVERVAEALEAAWLERDEIAELFIGGDELVALLQS